MVKTRGKKNPSPAALLEDSSNDHVSGDSSPLVSSGDLDEPQPSTSAGHGVSNTKRKTRGRPRKKKLRSDSDSEQSSLQSSHTRDSINAEGSAIHDSPGPDITTDPGRKARRKPTRKRRKHSKRQKRTRSSSSDSDSSSDYERTHKRRRHQKRRHSRKRSKKAKHSGKARDSSTCSSSSSSSDALLSSSDSNSSDSSDWESDDHILPSFNSHQLGLAGRLPVKLRKKICRNQFVDLDLLLAAARKPSALFERKKRSKNSQALHFPPIRTVIEWVTTFNVYAAVYSNKCPDEGANLFHYVHVILELARLQGDFLGYDKEFRLARAGPRPPAWHAHNSELYTCALINAAGNRPSPFRNQRPDIQSLKLDLSDIWLTDFSAPNVGKLKAAISQLRSKVQPPMYGLHKRLVFSFGSILLIIGGIVSVAFHYVILKVKRLSVLPGDSKRSFF